VRNIHSKYFTYIAASCHLGLHILLCYNKSCTQCLVYICTVYYN